EDGAGFSPVGRTEMRSQRRQRRSGGAGRRGTGGGGRGGLSFPCRFCRLRLACPGAGETASAQGRNLVYHRRKDRGHHWLVRNYQGDGRGRVVSPLFITDR